MLFANTFGANSILSTRMILVSSLLYFVLFVCSFRDELWLLKENANVCKVVGETDWKGYLSFGFVKEFAFRIWVMGNSRKEVYVVSYVAMSNSILFFKDLRIALLVNMVWDSYRKLLFYYWREWRLFFSLSGSIFSKWS